MRNDLSMYRRKRATEEAFEKPHLENKMALLRDRLEAKPIYDVEPEITEWARHYANVFLARFKNGTFGERWKGEERNNYIGMIAHKCFELVLQQHEIPYIPNDPIIDWHESKHYDFRIPSVGTIEVKAIDYKENQKSLLIKCSEWHNNDFCVALKLCDTLPNNVKIMGYATSEDVTEKFHHAENEMPCPNAPCYWELLEKLKHANEFIQMLINATQPLWPKHQ